MENVIQDKRLWQPKQIVVLLEIYDCLKEFKHSETYVSEVFLIRRLKHKKVDISLRTLRRYLNFFMYMELFKKITLHRNAYAYKLNKIDVKQDEE